MNPYRVANPDLAPQGVLKIEWAESRMPVLMALRQRLQAERPFNGHRIVGSNHITKESAVLLRALCSGGAEVAWCPSNPLTTQDDVAAAIAKAGVHLFAWHGMSKQEYYWAMAQALTALPGGPTLALDEGGDLMVCLHTKYPELARLVVGGTDKTTTGVERMRALAQQGALCFPVLAVNDAITKWEFDNTYGTGQSIIDGILRATGMLLAGKTFVVGGFGHVGRGVALRAHGLGARVVVTEVRPTTAFKAVLEGFRVMTMDEAAPIGDVFCTASGMRDVVRGHHLDAMKSGAVLCNAGHFDCEINLEDLDARSVGKRAVRPHCEEYLLKDGRRVYLLGQGRVVNLAAGEGNPSEVMDLTFTTQVVALLQLIGDAGPRDPGVYKFSREEDEKVARLKLATLGVATDQWSDEQHRYLKQFMPGM